MKPPRHRLVAAILGAGLSLLSLEAIERYRATQPPPGWTRTGGAAVAMTPPAWRISNSAWRLGPGSTWSSDDAHQQLYVRADLEEGGQIGMTLSTHEDAPLWIWLAEDGRVAAMHNETVVPCMGRITQNSAIEAIELTLDKDGLKVKKGNTQMICPADTATADPPQIQALHSTVELQSVGRDRRTDGKPLSPLWWMSGLMGLGFLWMLLFDFVLVLGRRIRSFAPIAEE